MVYTRFLPISWNTPTVRHIHQIKCFWYFSYKLFFWYMHNIIFNKNGPKNVEQEIHNRAR